MKIEMLHQFLCTIHIFPASPAKYLSKFVMPFPSSVNNPNNETSTEDLSFNRMSFCPVVLSCCMCLYREPEAKNNVFDRDLCYGGFCHLLHQLPIIADEQATEFDLNKLSSIHDSRNFEQIVHRAFVSKYSFDCVNAEPRVT